MARIGQASRGTQGAAVWEMALIHRIFRREFRAAMGYVRKAPANDSARIKLISEHLEFLLQALHIHHTTEDDLVWPRLLERATMMQEMTHRMEAQHEGIHHAIVRVREANGAWAKAPDPALAEALILRLEEFLAITEAHLDEEERDVVPLIDQYLSLEEWEEVGKRGFEKFKPSQRWTALGLMLSAATEGEAETMLGKLPLPVRLLWPITGKRVYRRSLQQLSGR